jgi:hypothetical protein
MPVKCLSCDKDLEPNPSPEGPPPSSFGHRSVRSSLGHSGRPSFNNLKKRGRYNNNSVNIED